MPARESNPFLEASTIVLTVSTCNTLAFRQTKMLHSTFHRELFIWFISTERGNENFSSESRRIENVFWPKRNSCVVCVFSWDFQNMRIVWYALCIFMLFLSVWCIIWVCSTLVFFITSHWNLYLYKSKHVYLCGCF